jgi:hypothetical protein
VSDILSSINRYPSYENLGLIIDQSDVANAGVAYSQIFTNYEWANNFIFKIQSNQSYDVYLYKITDGITDWGNAVATGLGSTSTSYAGITSTIPVGQAFRIGLINKSGGDTATFKCYLEVKK